MSRTDTCKRDTIESRARSLSRPLGPLQRRLLDALRRHAGQASLAALTAFVAGLIPDLNARPPEGRIPRRAVYVATARAVAALRRRGLVDTEIAGTAKGRLEWAPGARPLWRFRNPSTRLLVRAVVDSLVPKL
jgi:hypothetical protein